MRKYCFLGRRKKVKFDRFPGNNKEVKERQKKGPLRVSL